MDLLGLLFGKTVLTKTDSGYSYETTVNRNGEKVKLVCSVSPSGLDIEGQSLRVSKRIAKLEDKVAKLEEKGNEEKALAVKEDLEDARGDLIVSKVNLGLDELKFYDVSKNIFTGKSKVFLGGSKVLTFKGLKKDITDDFIKYLGENGAAFGNQGEVTDIKAFGFFRTGKISVGADSITVVRNHKFGKQFSCFEITRDKITGYETIANKVSLGFKGLNEKSRVTPDANFYSTGVNVFELPVEKVSFFDKGGLLKSARKVFFGGEYGFYVNNIKEETAERIREFLVTNGARFGNFDKLITKHFFFTKLMFGAGDDCTVYFKRKFFAKRVTCTIIDKNEVVSVDFRNNNCKAINSVIKQNLKTGEQWLDSVNYKVLPVEEVAFFDKGGIIPCWRKLFFGRQETFLLDKIPEEFTKTVDEFLRSANAKYGRNEHSVKKLLWIKTDTSVVEGLTLTYKRIRFAKVFNFVELTEEKIFTSGISRKFGFVWREVDVKDLGFYEKKGGRICCGNQEFFLLEGLTPAQVEDVHSWMLKKDPIFGREEGRVTKKMGKVSVYVTPELITYYSRFMFGKSFEYIEFKNGEISSGCTLSKSAAQVVNEEDLAQQAADLQNQKDAYEEFNENYANRPKKSIGEIIGDAFKALGMALLSLITEVFVQLGKAIKDAVVDGLHMLATTIKLSLKLLLTPFGFIDETHRQMAAKDVVFFDITGKKLYFGGVDTYLLTDVTKEQRGTMKDWLINNGSKIGDEGTTFKRRWFFNTEVISFTQEAVVYKQAWIGKSKTSYLKYDQIDAIMTTKCWLGFRIRFVVAGALSFMSQYTFPSKVGKMLMENSGFAEQIKNAKVYHPSIFSGVKGRKRVSVCITDKAIVYMDARDKKHPVLKSLISVGDVQIAKTPLIKIGPLVLLYHWFSLTHLLVWGECREDLRLRTGGIDSFHVEGINTFKLKKIQRELSNFTPSQTKEYCRTELPPAKEGSSLEDKSDASLSSSVSAVCAVNLLE